MNVRDWQTHLKATGRYAGAIDGLWGRLTDAGTLLALSDGPDTALTLADFTASAARLGVQTAAIRAFWSVEAAGAGFEAGRPKILPERHIFSKLTGRRFDRTFPALSSPTWDKSWYPRTQDARYDVLLQWCRLDIDAAFAACSYGAPQILGSNYAACGYANAAALAEAFARDEVTQLRGFEAFVRSAGIVPYLRKVGRSPDSWAPVAQRYNGTAYRANGYHEKMAAAFTRLGGQ